MFTNFNFFDFTAKAFKFAKNQRADNEKNSPQYT